MARSGKFIQISSTNANGHTPLGINGRHRNLPHNEPVAVSDAELETLTNSHVDFEVKGDAKASDLTAAVDQEDGGETGAENPTGQVPGGDNLAHASANDTPVAVNLDPGASEQVPGADSLVHGEPRTVDVAQAEQDARDAAQAALDGTTEPVVVLNNTGDEPAGDGASGHLAVEPFDAGKTLDQSVVKITEDLDEFSPEQIDALLKAEKANKNRPTLIAALERKRAN